MSVPLEWIVVGGALLAAVGFLIEIALDGARFVGGGREL